MLTSPITVTIATVAHSLSKINQDNFSSVYLKKWTDNELRLTIRHSYEGKTSDNQIERHNVELQHTKWDAEGKQTVSQAYLVMRIPRNAGTSALSDDTKGLMDFVESNITSLVGWES